ncbi:MAG: Na/Pi symporter [bacterium]
MNSILFTTIYSIIAVVIVFLFAIKKFGGQIQSLIGEKFKSLIEKSTDTPIKGVLVGTIITSILQSSTAVSVLLVSLVESGIFPFTNSLGVIIGANIGTTITSQLVALNLLNIAPFILIIGFLLMKIKHKYQHLGKPIFYFGLIFSCLFIISVMTSSFIENGFLLSIISHTSNLFFAIFAGFVVSTVLQSSSITTGIIIILASQGILNLDQAFGIILGTNIGTTTTAILASLVTGKRGKRVALAHFLFNFIGVLIFLPFVHIFSQFIKALPINIAWQVALAHLIFNVIIASIFVIFFNQFNRLIHKIIQ